MANICSNKFYIFADSKEIIEKIKDKFTKILDTTLEGCIDYCDENIIEGYFDSKWDFPENVFKDFFEEFNDNSIYMRCLSEEYGNELVSMNIYDGKWREPQYFNL